MTPTRHRWMRVAASIALVLVASVALAAPAAAQDTTKDDDDQVVLTGRLIVPSDDTVRTAVLFDGSATIDGTVEESLVVFNGDAVVKGTVAGDVVVFNGEVRIASGAEVGGDLITRSDPVIESGATVRGDRQQVTWDLDASGIGFASRIVWWIAYTVSALVLGLLLLLFAPRVDAAVTRAVRDRMGAAAGFGAITFFAVPIVAVLLLVTVVAIPLGLFVLLALALIYTVAYVVGAHAIGRLVVKPPTSRYVAFLAGLGIVRLIALIPVAGGIAWLLVTILGFGVALVAIRAGWSEAPVAPSTTVPPIPPTPAAGAPA